MKLKAESSEDVDWVEVLKSDHVSNDRRCHGSIMAYCTSHPSRYSMTMQ